MDPDPFDYLAGPDQGTVQDAVQTIADRFGVDYVTLHLFRGGDDAKNQPYVRTNYPDAWVSRYLLNDYIRIDPVLRTAATSVAPFCWSTIPLEPKHEEMMTQALDHGLGQTGFSVGHVDTIGRRSVLSFNAHHAQGGPTWAAYIAQHHDNLLALTAHLHAKALSEILGTDVAPPHLSRRETECLKWTADGKTHTEIAIILNLSEHTVRSYLKAARVKLDAVSLAQAVSKASSLGLI